MSPTKIEWTDETWNPLVGCSKVGPGCDHCYAVGVAHRGLTDAHRGLTIRRPGEPPDWTGEVRTVPHRLEQPLAWKRPRRVFVNSLSDLFHPAVDDLFIAEVFAVMSLAPQHTFQVLTKRPKAMAALLASDEFRYKVSLERKRRIGFGAAHPPPVWPLPNVWLGVSIETPRYQWRANYLRDTPAAVRFISAEPLLGPLFGFCTGPGEWTGPVHGLDLTGIDWVIAGGESGAAARPMSPQWVRDLRDRCNEAGVAFLFKQWGSWAPITDTTPRRGDRLMACAYRDVYMRRGDKRTNGRLLDGRTWDEFPR